MKIILKKLLFVFILLALTQPLSAGNIQCWTDENGNRACADSVPPQHSQGGFIVYNDEGIKIKEIERAPSKEEIAAKERQKDEERQRQEQRKKDDALLALFSTERDIELARAGVLSSIDGQLQSLQTILDGIKGNLEDLLLSYERSQNNESVSQSQLEAIQRNIERVKKRIADNEATLQNKLKEREKINLEYDDYVQRYREIMRRRSRTPIENTR
jgi:chromosome segregation ATPase